VCDKKASTKSQYLTSRSEKISQLIITVQEFDDFKPLRHSALGMNRDGIFDRTRYLGELKMKLRSIVLLAFSLHSVLASAKPSLAVAKFEDKMVSSKCSVHKSPELTAKMQRQLTAIFNNYSDLRVMDPAQTKPGSSPRYVINGALRSYDQCHAANPNDQRVKVAIDLKVFDSRTGRMAFSYTSSANATGSASALGQTAKLVLNDLAFHVEKALINRKSTTRIVSKSRKLASQEVMVKLVPRAQ
jgi:hypothetical protein